jgi:hypothetical protein
MNKTGTTESHIIHFLHHASTYRHSRSRIWHLSDWLINVSKLELSSPFKTPHLTIHPALDTNKIYRAPTN